MTAKNPSIYRHRPIRCKVRLEVVQTCVRWLAKKNRAIHPKSMEPKSMEKNWTTKIKRFAFEASLPQRALWHLMGWLSAPL